MTNLQFGRLVRPLAGSCHSLILTFAFVTAILALFYSPIVASAQESCGNILIERFGETEVFPISDCNDPFQEIDGDLISEVRQTINGELLLPEASVVISEVRTLDIQSSITFTDQPENVFVYSSLYRMVGEDYVLVSDPFNQDLLIDNVEPGKYVLMTEVEGVPVVGYNSNWLHKIKSFIIPTAHAQFADFAIERVATPFTVVLEEPEPTGASSVLFLPGIQASRLYKDGLLGTEDQVWEPNFNEDVADLEFDDSFQSVNNVYTRDVIDSVDVLFGLVSVADIYKNFLTTFTALEHNGQIVEFLPFAYDWRYDVFHVATQDVAYPNNEIKRLKEEIERMSVGSKNGKVTIVAHSNGGLVLKALFDSYPEQNFREKIDKVVMVGTPQIGAPKAIASLLHGYDQGTPFQLKINTQTVRRISLNLPSAYGLLPSDEYLTSGAAPTVFFDSSESTSQFREQYGNAINGSAELDAFLLGQEGRDNADTIEAAAIVNETLLQNAGEQADILNSLIIPSEIEFYSIVGTGKETEVAFEYRGFEERICTQELFTEVCETEVFYKPVPILSLDGDGTVPAVSASYDGIVHYVDIRDTPYDHKNLTEYDEILEFIETVVLDEELTVNNTKPVYSSDQLLIGIHSPMEILVTDAEGNRLGVMGENILTDIPNSSYRELAGSKYVTVPVDTDVEIVFTGKANGGATVTIDEFNKDGQVVQAVVPIPVVSPTTRSSLSINNSKVSNLETDVDGDGVIDEIRTPNGELIIVDNPEFTYSELLTIIAKIDNRFAKRFLTRVAERAEKFGQKSQVNSRFEKVEFQLLKLLEKSTKRFERRGIIESDLAEEVLIIISAIKK